MTTAYIRVSDKHKADEQTQRDAIQQYADRHDITVHKWVVEFVSATSTDIQDRELSKLVGTDDIIVTEVSRLGRKKVFRLLGVIGDIAEKHTLHLAYVDKRIDATNVDDAEVIFTTIGSSFAAQQEAVARSNRAKAAVERRKASGLAVGRQKGTKVKSKLNDHAVYIMEQLAAGTSKLKLLRQLESERGVKVSRQALYNFINDKLNGQGIATG